MERTYDGDGNPKGFKPGLVTYNMTVEIGDKAITLAISDEQYAQIEAAFAEVLAPTTRTTVEDV